MVDSKRIRQLNSITQPQDGPIIYWMRRDQRVVDNWALLYAQELADQRKTEVLVVFCLREEFPHCTERLIDFMITGLEEVETQLTKLNIPFQFLLGDSGEEIPKLIEKLKPSAVVSDFFPLRHTMSWHQSIAKQANCQFFEVDAHNIVPCWIASPKLEYGAYTFRPKINRLLSEFLTEFPKLHPQKSNLKISQNNWTVIRSKIKTDNTVKAITWLKPGNTAANKILDKLIDQKLEHYATDRNDPSIDGLSNLSPYLHFGHISAQRVALAIGDIKTNHTSKAAFLEELIVRRELSDNWCFYNQNYDNLKNIPNWAQKTLDQHAKDPRPFIYSLEQLEQAATDDPLWNAAQTEMNKTGKMHGYLRMYWAKKIFEWSNSAEEAIKHCCYLNDRYFLDGRDPNGYVGIMWAVAGVHDRPWFDRPIFGQIRYMSYNGAKSKFNIEEYIARVESLKA